MTANKPGHPMPPIEQIRADVARAEELLEQVRQLLGVAAAVSFGDIDPSRAGDEPVTMGGDPPYPPAQPVEDATARVQELAGDMRASLGEAVAGMPWLVRLSDEERARLQASAPSRAELEAMRGVVEVLEAMDPEELEEASRKAAEETGQVLTRADIRELRDNLERIELMERLQAHSTELARLAKLLMKGEIEAAHREAAEEAAAKEQN